MLLRKTACMLSLLCVLLSAAYAFAEDTNVVRLHNGVEITMTLTSQPQPPQKVWAKKIRVHTGTNMDTEPLDRFFADLRESIVPLIARVCAAKPIDESPLHVPFPIDKQRALTDAVMKRMLLDRAHVGVGETEHPFTTNFSKYDVRITTHYFTDNFASGMFSTIHEGGHALYESNTADELAYTRLGEGVSMAVHESQSRFYENIIGRSRAFVSLIAPELRALCPALESVSEEALYEPGTLMEAAFEAPFDPTYYVRYLKEKYEALYR